MITVTNEASAGTLKLADLKAAQSALFVLFANMSQPGPNNQPSINAQAQSAVLRNQSPIQAFIQGTPPTSAQIQGLYNQAQSRGSTVDAATFGRAFAVNAAPQALQQFLTDMQNTGMLGLEQQTNSTIMALESTLSSLGSGHQPLNLAAYRNGSAHLLRVSACAYEVLAIAWGALALCTPPPLDLLCGLIALYYQFAALLFC